MVYRRHKHTVITEERIGMRIVHIFFIWMCLNALYKPNKLQSKR